ncbi:uncharacterized protein LOC120181150 [Hibiscus syriacus]|uniref:uncharacterized protein LOC120181150 n=1 Tax=Hibiscus syriacus TaxID=106335 RepID=UPI001923C9E2|nr:uncharacterized protein LOC120181150 [Hibiscus syriacus]
MPEPVQPVRFDVVPSEENPRPPCLSDYKEKEVVREDEEEPLIQSAECSICQDEDSIKNLETAFNEYAHSNDKGNINCEICHQPYQPDYTALPRVQTEETTIDIGYWSLDNLWPLDLRDPRLLAIAEAERQFLETEYDEYAALNASGAAFCRSTALVLMALLLLHHAFDVPDADSDEDVYTVFSFGIFLFCAAVILLPCYIMARAIGVLQRRRQRRYQEAAGAAIQVALVGACILPSHLISPIKDGDEPGSFSTSLEPLHLIKDFPGVQARLTVDGLISTKTVEAASFGLNQSFKSIPF